MIDSVLRDYGGEPMIQSRQSRWYLVAGILLLGVCVVAASAAAQQSDASRKALESAAAKGSAPAQYALGAAAETQEEFGRAAEWYRQAAENGYAAAQFKLGSLFERGQGVPKDLETAKQWYNKSAQQGFEAAVVHLEELGQPTSSPGSVPSSAADSKVLPQQPAANVMPSGRSSNPVQVSGGEEKRADSFVEMFSVPQTMVIVFVAAALLAFGFATTRKRKNQTRTEFEDAVTPNRKRKHQTRAEFEEDVVTPTTMTPLHERQEARGRSKEPVRAASAKRQSVVVMEIRRQPAGLTLSQPQPIGNGKWVISWTNKGLSGTTTITRGTLGTNLQGADLHFHWTDVG